MASGQPVVGVDVGGTNVRAAVFDPGRWEWLAPPVRRAVAAESGQVVDLVADAIRTAVDQASLRLEEIAAVGVGFPGIIDPQAGRSLLAVNLPQWSGGPLRNWLKERLGRPVRVENDVRAGGLGEFLLGAGRGTSSMIYVSAGTGIGGALLLEGKAWLGATFQAGEIGHVVLDPSEEAPRCRCGQRGDAEAFLSGRAIEEAAHASGLKLTAGAALEAGKDPAHPASALRAQVTRYLALLLSNLQKLLDPEVLVMGGGLGLHPAYPVEEAARRFWGQDALETQQAPRVCRATLGSHSGLFGAALLAAGRGLPGGRSHAGTPS